MRVCGLPKAFYHMAQHPVADVSPQAEERLRWLQAWRRLRERGMAAREACQVLGLARATVYRWWRRLRQHGPGGLEERSHRPHRTRLPQWTTATAKAVLQVREAYPRWGKDKLVVLLRRAGYALSPSMVGRILARLKARGVLREPPRPGIKARRRRWARPHAVRKPQDYQPQQPGDLVQVDTLDLRPLPGVVRKQFTARDVVARWDVVAASSRATATTAARFLETLLARFPFPVRAIQVDGGSEFRAAFEEACQARGLPLFVLPPRSPKLNGHVERAQRTHTEEFHQLYDGDLDLPSLNAALRAWERVYNTVRPHQALDGRTPAEYLALCHPELVPSLSHIP